MTPRGARPPLLRRLAATIAMVSIVGLAACQPAAPPAKPSAGAAAPESQPGPGAPAAPPAASTGPSQAAPARSTKDTLTLVNVTPQGSLDPHFAGSHVESLFVRNLYSALVKYQYNTTEIVPDLATSWEVSRDGTEYTFKLRPDVEWHKGYGKLTAQDVKDSFDRLMSPETRSPFAGDLAVVREIQVVDEHTVKFVLKEPYAPFLHVLTPWRTGPIVNVRAVREKGADFAWDPIGTGPYQFESRVPNRESVMVANERYFGGAPRIKKIVYRVVQDPNAQVVGLEGGDYDRIFIGPADRAVLERLKGRGFRETIIDRGSPNVLYMNTTAKPFDDVRVRQAIAHSIDRQQYIELAWGGLGQPIYSPLPPGYWAHTSDIPRYEHDPSKAKQLLAEAGYPNGLDVTMTNYDIGKFAGEVIIEQLRQGGIRVTHEVLDSPSWNARVNQGQGVNFTLHCCLRQPDPDLLLSALFTPRGGVMNVSKYNLESELVGPRRETDPRLREQMYQELQRKVMRDVPIVPLILQPERDTHVGNLKGLPSREALYGLDFTQVYFD